MLSFVIESLEVNLIGMLVFEQLFPQLLEGFSVDTVLKPACMLDE